MLLFYTVLLGLTAEHSQRLGTLLSAPPAVRDYRVGSNRVPNGTPASARPDLSLLREVLIVSQDDATITAEPGVTMEELVAAALKKGLMPKVVPEFRAITVGGAIMGGAMESGSFAHGMFHDTVASCELLLPNGTLTVASRSTHADLLAAIGGSYGTLASLTAATIECVRLPHTLDSKPPRVALSLAWHADLADGVAALSAMARAGGLDFLDALALPQAASAGTASSGGSERVGVRRPASERQFDPWPHGHRAWRARRPELLTEQF